MKALRLGPIGMGLLRQLAWMVAVGLLGVVAAETRFGDWLHRLSYDSWFLFRPDQPPRDVVLVYLDDDSHRRLGQPYDRPWDRRLHAALVRRLTEEGALLVFFDVVFDQPGVPAEGDPELAAAMQDNGRVILSAGILELAKTGSEQGIRETRLEIFAPIAPLRRAALGWGLAKQEQDADFTVRRLATGATDLPHPTATWRAAGHLDPCFEQRAGPREKERWINYPCAPSDLAAVGFAQALTPGELPSGYFKGKIVFIGARSVLGYTGAGKDTFRMPHGLRGAAFADGVAIQALCLENLRHGNWLTPLPEGANRMVLFLTGCLLGALFWPCSPRWGVVLLPVAAGTLFLLPNWFIAHTGHFGNSLVPLAVQLPVAFVGSVGARYYQEVRRRQRLKRSFAAYVSPVMVNRMVESGEEPQLGGHEAVITAFFSDLENFSTFSEALSSARLVDLMNQYLGAMTEILQEEMGTLDKYIGDAVVAMFGAPLDLPDHAARACRCAWRMQQRTAELRRAWSAPESPWPPVARNLRMRVGLNTGPATIGNMGSRFRFNYTMMGDTVNLAARCESAAKSYGIYTLVTDDTREAALRDDPTLVFRFVDRIVVKGRTRPVEIFELFGPKDQLPAGLATLLADYELGLSRYRSRAWAEAESIFRATAQREEHRPSSERPKVINPSLVLAERCRLYRQEPPPKDWDGTHHMLHK